MANQDGNFSVDDILNEVKTKRAAPAGGERHKADVDALLEEIMREREEKNADRDKIRQGNPLPQSPAAIPPADAADAAGQTRPKSKPSVQPQASASSQDQPPVRPKDPVPVKDADLAKETSIPEPNDTAAALAHASDIPEDEAKSTAQTPFHVSIDYDKHQFIKTQQLERQEILEAENRHSRRQETPKPDQNAVSADESEPSDADVMSEIDTPQGHGALPKTRKRKIKEFVLVGEEEENDPSEPIEPPKELPAEEIEDLTSPDDIPSIAADLKALKRSLILRAVILLILALAGIGLAAINQLSFITPPAAISIAEEPAVYGAIQLLLLLAAIGFSYTTVFQGIWNFIRLKPDRDSLAATATVICVIQNIFLVIHSSALSDRNVHLYAPLAVLGLLFNTWGKIKIVRRTRINFKMIASKYNKYAAGIVEDEDAAMDLTRGLINDVPAVAYKRKTGFLQDFLTYSYGEDLSDKFSVWLCPLAVACSLILGFAAFFVTKSWSAAVTGFTATICIFSPLSYLLVINTPLLRAARHLAKHGGAVLGYQAAEEFSDLNCAVVGAKDLFPEGAVTLMGIKTFGSLRVDEAILDAASVVCEAKSVLTDVFTQVIAGKMQLLKKVDSILYEDSMGISAWVDNKRILIGTRELMLNHGVEVPEKSYEEKYAAEGQELVYLSNSGELTAVFIVSLNAAPQVQAALGRLEESDVFLVVKSVDALVTKEKLAEVFDVEPAMFKILPARLHETCDTITAKSESESAPVACSASFLSFVSSILSARRLKSTAILGMVVQLASVLVGFGILFVFSFLRDFSQMTTMMLILYELAWFILTALIQRGKKI